MIAASDRSGNIIKEFSYDAWGRRRSTDNWTNYSVTLDALGTGGTQLFTRGFCFHEHLDVFGLINMNGRMYDPRLGRFLSPDMVVQAPDNSQSYNRYSYCMNNPLKYTDLTGYTWGIFKPFVKAAKWAGNIVATVVVDVVAINIIIPYAIVVTAATTVVGLGQLATGKSTILKNEAKIIGGLVTGSPGQILSRFTWELPQTIVGYTASQGSNMIGDVKSVSYYNGATVVQHYSSLGGAFTIGSYINAGNKCTNIDIMHEYGHYLQSQSVGPTYLCNYALPSLINASQFSDTDPEGQNKHNAFWVEQDADIRARNYFGDSNWNYDQYPILGDPRDPTDYTNNYGDYYNYMGSNWFENMYKWLNTAKN